MKKKTSEHRIDDTCMKEVTVNVANITSHRHNLTTTTTT